MAVLFVMRWSDFTRALVTRYFYSPQAVDCCRLVWYITISIGIFLIWTISAFDAASQEESNKWVTIIPQNPLHSFMSSCLTEKRINWNQFGRMRLSSFSLALGTGASFVHFPLAKFDLLLGPLIIQMLSCMDHLSFRKNLETQWKVAFSVTIKNRQMTIKVAQEWYH